jgi:hypothetical protein
MTVERLDPVQYAIRITSPATNVRREPSAQAEVLTTYACGAAPLTLDAVAAGEASELKWYHVAEGGWVREDVVELYADATEAADAAYGVDCSSSGQGEAVDYAPATGSVWEFVQGEDLMTGTCTTGPILPPYGLVQIIPGGETLTWRSQEPAPYTFSRVQTNVYAYGGPTAVGDGIVAMTLTFTSATTLRMTRAFVPASDPGCTHTHNYSGAFQWALP